MSPDRDYAGRVDIVDEDRRWTYGVTADGSVRLLDAFDDGTAIEEPDDPEYVDDVFLTLDLPGGRR
ncbi:hypothetical protein ACFSBX_10325 [Halobellus rarus]|uniref:Uncharacterized protein n=1 Tax=Halobellus rarus TaxID=1126237 RepID=A0ABD6CNC0_9EURY